MDAGTGTAIFLRDLTNHETTKDLVFDNVVGFDLSSLQFPDSAERKLRTKEGDVDIQLFEQSLLEKLSLEHMGKYDLVCQRLMVCDLVLTAQVFMHQPLLCLSASVYR